MASARRIIYAPEICPDACLLFSYTNEHDRSFRLRHHGPSGSIEIQPQQCADHVTTSWIQGRVRRQQNADRVPFDDAGYWSGRLAEYTRNWIGSAATAPTLSPEHIPLAARAVRTGSPAVRESAGASQFPILDLDLLRASRKGGKPQDMERILGSANSEDYVTWALVSAWRRCSPDWWRTVMELAAAQAPGVSPAIFAAAPPEIRPWIRVPSPPAYERMSRQRMASSGDPALRSRAQDPRAVEGETEVDVAFEGADYLVFVEAKLGSDISLSTTYDPSRNQLARNIDCVLEQAQGRAAAMWLFVRDTDPSRLYVSLVDSYRSEPLRLHRLLPHRDPAEVEAIASRLAVIRWSDLLDTIRPERDAAAVREVLDEVRGRLGSW